MRTENSGLYQRDGIWWSDLRKHGKRYRRSLHTKDVVTARRLHAMVLDGLKDKSRDRYVPASAREVWNCLMRCKDAAIRRDKLRGRVACMSTEDMRALVERCGGCCEATGIPFSVQAIEGKLRRRFAPSIDRLDTSLPYSVGNVRLICVAANIAINEWGDEVFDRIAQGFVSKRYTA